MPTRPIKIMKGNPSTGVLKLDDDGHTRADAGDTILWQISQGSGVASIVLIKEKSSSAKFWTTAPSRRGANWAGDINSKAAVGAEYDYAIHWKASPDGPVLIYDPKISIRPS